MMSSEATSSPVSASTLAYLMRWPVLRLIWLKLTFSVSEVAGYNATGQVTSERRRKPFQLARGAMIRTSENYTKEPGLKRGKLNSFRQKGGPDHSGASTKPKGHIRPHGTVALTVPQQR